MLIDWIFNFCGKVNLNFVFFIRYFKKISFCIMIFVDLVIVVERSFVYVVVGDVFFINKWNYVGNDVCVENDFSCRNISIDNRDSYIFKNDGFIFVLKIGMLLLMMNIESYM